MSPRAGIDRTVLLHTAAKLADCEGLEAVSLARLAQTLGVKSPSLYNHVHGLKGLRRALALHALERMYDALAQSAVGKAGDDAVIALGKAYVGFVRAHPGQYEASLLPPDPDDKELDEAQSRIVELAIRCFQAYRLTPDGLLHAVRGLRSLCHGFATLEQRGGFGLPLDLNVTLQLLLEAFVSGMRALQNKQREHASNSNPLV
ncbi:TetR family transcriptional regulator [Gordoniibacillus kamchatkensis]|uniref:TetR family transcriptional regulator n=1 Tax=Gordoniibacillus kamchatkensis TaxID=1590651 RepID=A0ABR5AFS6_9BACL|nr:TetR/AcrR family transcriptional regulator [Paenibacillus sp. VKM B-2647]KIL39899.1 TetR family transcriptional regulator [Paenibacillus sp. VKM B-2647]